MHPQRKIPGPPPEESVLELARALARRLARAEYDRTHPGESAESLGASPAEKTEK